MRVACNECAVVVDLEGLRAVDGGFGFICNHCGQINVLAPVAAAPEPEAAAPAPEAPLPPGMVECPKCFHRQYDHDSCHRCGLDFARVADGTAKFVSDPLAGHALADTLGPMWARLQRDLDDTEGHRRFIQACAEAGLLEYAGQCYRKVLSTNGVEDPRVRHYRDRVIQAALARADGLERRSTKAIQTKGKRLIGVVATLLILALLAAGYAFVMSRTSDLVPPG